MDVLSDVLRTVRLTGAVFFPMETSSPWADEIPAASAFAEIVLPGAQQVVSYHIVTEEFALAESRQQRAGGRCVLLRLSEVLFVEVVRRYLDALPADHNGWLAGLRDPIVGRALTRLHGRPAHAWTLERLARDVAISRSALAERFTQIVGQPPMRYLTRWRMQLAARMLADGAAKVSAVALDVGYDSEASFSRAFKKIVGVAPAAWRESARSAAAPPSSAPARRVRRRPPAPAAMGHRKRS